MLVADPVTAAKSGNSSDSVPGPKLAVSAVPEHGDQVQVATRCQCTLEKHCHCC